MFKTKTKLIHAKTYRTTYTPHAANGLVLRSDRDTLAIHGKMAANAMAKVIPIRFSDEEHARYEAMAAEAFPKPLPLSTYLKRRLAAGDDMADAITMLGRAIDDLGHHDVGQRHADISPADTSKVLLEILLLLRAVANPQHVRSVQGELQRLGIGAWQAREPA
jgi:hypothetical protein